MKTTLFIVLAIVGSSATAAAQQAHVNLDWNPHKNTQGLSPYGANLISPEVMDDRTVSFSV
jgi:enterochelin esterase family protein